MGQKKFQTCFCQKVVKYPPNLINFLHTDREDNRIMWRALIFYLT